MAKIQTETPDIAEFLILINQHFGKPVAVFVKNGDEVLLSTGKVR